MFQTNFKKSKDVIMTKKCRICKTGTRKIGLAICSQCESKKRKEREEKRKQKRKEKKEAKYSTFETKADNLWRKAINEKWKGKCAICGKSEKLNAHHYIGRRNRATRWYIPNGILLCVEHHKFGIQSAHEQPEWFREQMLHLLGDAWLKDITRQANKIWDKNRDNVLQHLNYERDNY